MPSCSLETANGSCEAKGIDFPSEMVGPMFWSAAWDQGKSEIYYDVLTLAPYLFHSFYNRNTSHKSGWKVVLLNLTHSLPPPSALSHSWDSVISKLLELSTWTIWSNTNIPNSESVFDFSGLHFTVPGEQYLKILDFKGNRNGACEHKMRFLAKSLFQFCFFFQQLLPNFMWTFTTSPLGGSRVERIKTKSIETNFPWVI